MLRSKSPRISQTIFFDKIAAFNNKWPTEKVRDVISQVNADPLPEGVETEIKDLFGFRNDVVHNDPIYHSSEFAKIFQIKKGKGKKMIEKRPRQYKYYAELTSSNRPLLLVHAIVATIAHDKLIEHITSTARDVDIIQFLNEIDMTNNESGLIWSGFMPGIDYDSTKQLSQEMNAVNTDLSKVTIKEMTAFLKEIMP